MLVVFGRSRDGPVPRHEIKNLPNVLSSLSESSRQDILLQALDEVFRERESEPDQGIERLRYLKNSGVADPDVDMFLAEAFRSDRLSGP